MRSWILSLSYGGFNHEGELFVKQVLQLHDQRSQAFCRMTNSSYMDGSWNHFFCWENSISNTLMDHKHLFYLCEQLAKKVQKIQLSNIQQSLVWFDTCTQYPKDEKSNNHIIQIISNWKIKSVTITIHIYIT